MKFLNRFGVCVSYDTLLRHIQEKVEEEEQKGLLLGLTPDGIIIFTTWTMLIFKKVMRRSLMGTRS